MASMFEWQYQVNETDAQGRSYRVVVQSHYFSGAYGAYLELRKQQPNSYFVMSDGLRIVHNNVKWPAPDPRPDPETYRGAEERMCGRYAITLPPEAMRQLFGAGNERINFGPRYNAAPTQQLPVIRYNPTASIRSLDLLRWGLVHRRAKDLSGGAKAINARAEGVATKWPFDDAFAKRRCLVPATAFYEWKKAENKQPYAIGLADGGTMAFAGVWEAWRAPAPLGQAEGEIIRTFSIITTRPNELMAPIHDRMPVILPPAAWPIWLGETPAEADQLGALLVPYPAGAMRAWRVGREVGSVKNDRQELLAELPSPAS